MIYETKPIRVQAHKITHIEYHGVERMLVCKIPGNPKMHFPASQTMMGQVAQPGYWLVLGYPESEAVAMSHSLFISKFRPVIKAEGVAA